MKREILVVILIVSISYSSNNVMDIIDCILKDHKIQEFVADVFNYIINGNYIGLISYVIANFDEIRKEVEKCIGLSHDTCFFPLN